MSFAKLSVAADATPPDLERPKKKRKAARAAAEGGAVGEIAAAQLQSGAPATDPDKKGKKKRKRNSTEEPETRLEAEAVIQHQPSSSQKTAENTTQMAADFSRANANSPAPTEQKKQSRSARRKQLKRRFRRLGVAPPPQDPPFSSLHGSESANPVPSSSDPSAPPIDPEVPTPRASGFPPPPKRLKTQPGKLEAQKSDDGHVYFAESGSESDLAEEDDATHADRAGKTDLHAEVQQSSQSHYAKQLAASKQQQNTAKEAALNGLTTRATPEVLSSRVKGLHPSAG